jgi:arylsulfatase
LGGSEIPEGIDGISFVPTLLGQKAKQKKHDYLFWRWSRFRAVRMGQWKGVQTNKTLALYNLNEDIGEERDIAGLHPDIVAKIKKIITELE